VAEPDPCAGWFAGRVAVVVGAGAGLGATLARRFSAAGARVALVARSEVSLEVSSAAARDAGGDPLAIAADVTSIDDVRRMATTIRERLGGADVLVNTAFASLPRRNIVDLDDAGLEAWRKAVEIGGYGTLLACRFVAPFMVERGSGAIVNVTSMSSRIGFAGRSEYSAGKAQGHKIAQSLAEQRGVAYEEILEEFTREMALRRIVTEDEVANAILFLASDLASGITGALLDVNAGHLFTP